MDKPSFHESIVDWNMIYAASEALHSQASALKDAVNYLACLYSPFLICVGLLSSLQRCQTAVLFSMESDCRVHVS